LKLRQNTVALVLPQALDPTAGGVQRTSLELGEFLASKGWRVAYVSLACCGRVPLPAGELYQPGNDISGNSRKIRSFVVSAIKKIQPNVVINQVGITPEPRNTLWELRRSMGFKVVACFRNNPAFFRDNYRHIVRDSLSDKTWLWPLIDRSFVWKLIIAFHRLKNRGLFSAALEQCDRFMLLSPTFFDELRWYIPDLDESKLVALPNGFSLPPPVIQLEKRNHILFVGRIENAQKNVFLIPELWKQLQDKLLGWELHIVGEGADRGALSAKIDALRLERVFLHGKQVPTSYYKRAKIFLMLSAYEGFGNTLIEAQMYGAVPVAFNSYSAINWMLNDGEDAILAPAFDIDQFARKVIELAEDSSTWQRMSAQAQQNAKRFSTAVVTQQWLNLLNELVSNAEGANA
jgi:glycosyltransferase involved in cell wall biosynthesis